MKSGTLGHIKVKKLKLRLKIPLWQAAGIIETLWQFGSDCADDGTVGRYSNEDIAAYMEWDGDPDELVGALIACRFLDEDDELRLVIHDWLEHCPNYVKERVRKRQERTPAPKPRTGVSLSGQTPDTSAPCPDETRTSSSQSELTHLTNPNPTKPNQGNPNPPGARKAALAAGDIAIPSEIDTPEVRDAVDRWLTHKRQIGKPYKSAETARLMFGDFTRAGPAAFVAAVNHSIGQNYQGIYAPSGSKNGNAGKASAGKEFSRDAKGDL